MPEAKNTPKITFGMIVLNGEPFMRYNLRALYSFAHQIIVIEGACPGAKDIATPDGHSSDTTLETLRHFKAAEDPEDKLIIVTAEDEGRVNGFWSEKDEMSQAYAKRATGNYLWQVDVDEFYLEEDMGKIYSFLETGINSIDFKTINFWGGLNYFVDGVWLISASLVCFRRIFMWGPGYQYIKHRPPTVIDANGCDTHSKVSISAEEMQAREIFLYHYSLLFPKQVKEKAAYYSKSAWCNFENANYWFNNNYMVLSNPFYVHDVYFYLSWLKRYRGRHPAQIYKMMEDINKGVLRIELRKNDDVEKLLQNPMYRFAAKMLEGWAYFCTTRIGRFIYSYGMAIYKKTIKFLHLESFCKNS